MSSTSSPETLPHAHTADNPLLIPFRRRVIIFVILAFGQFMALLDIQIVAASLNEIQAGLSAGPEEVSWVQTAYLMAELVMIPLSAFLGQAMSTRWLFALSAGLFTFSSVMCGLSWNIESMIAFRVLQGFTGGAMVPTVFAVAFMLFEGKERATVPAVLGIVSVLAPTLGPTVGGLITHLLDWRWIFFLNVVPGILVTLATIFFVHVDRPNKGMFLRIDYVHLISMIMFLACLQYVLEEGPKNDWFSDSGIVTAAWFSLIGFAVFLERSFWSKTPIIRLTAFRKYSFSFGCTFNLLVGFGMYGSIYLLPLYLGRVRDFDSLQIGTTLFVIGIAQLVGTLVAARVTDYVDRRLVITVGLVMFAASLWLNARMTPEWGFNELLVPQILRGLAIMLCVVPSVRMSMDGFVGPELRYAAGVFNLMRNLGGAIGIAVVNTWLQNITRMEEIRFSEAMGNSYQAAREMLGGLAGSVMQQVPDPQLAGQVAYAVLDRMVQREALTMGFNEVFQIMCLMFLAALVMVPFSGKPAPQEQGQPSEEGVH